MTDDDDLTAAEVAEILATIAADDGTRYTAAELKALITEGDDA